MAGLVHQSGSRLEKLFLDMRASRQARSSGFTLVEILVVMVIIVVLMGLVLPVVKASQNRANLARETNAGRNIMMAYFAYSSENEGALLPGYDKSVKKVTLRSGKSITGEMVTRYPWRLAPYIGEQINDIFLVNGGKKVTQGEAEGSFAYQYRASLNPALGINAYCVGGFLDGTSLPAFSTDSVRRLAAASHPSRLIVFASARMKVSGEGTVPGNFLISPPKAESSNWVTADFTPKSDPSDYGNVDLRWDGKALCAFLDGHVALLEEKELRDMRNWSNMAAENDDANWVVPR